MAIAGRLRHALHAFFPPATGRLDWSDSQITLALHGDSDQQRLHSCRKEPETVEWLRQHSLPGAVFYDIGANVGAYSLIPASLIKEQGRVYSFEPGYATFATLSENILLNTREKVITPLFVALGAENGFLTFNFSSLESGAAKHTVSRSSVAGMKSLEVPSMTLDDLRSILKMPAPTFLKIDVDGGEYELLEGARTTLALPTLQSVLIEIDLSEPRGEEIESIILRHGFRRISRHARGKGKSETLFNYIFKRI